MIHGQDDEAARKWEEFQNQPAGGEAQRARSIVKRGYLATSDSAE